MLKDYLEIYRCPFMVKLIVTPARISDATRLDFTLVSSAIFGYILGRNAALE